MGSGGPRSFTHSPDRWIEAAAFVYGASPQKREHLQPSDLSSCVKDELINSALATVRRETSHCRGLFSIRGQFCGALFMVK